MNPEAVIWLAVAVFGLIYLGSMVAAEISEIRERKRVRRILKGE